MLLGHYAAAFASKRVAPKVSLGWLFAAAQWPDLIWPILTLVGMEHFRIVKGDTAVTPLAFDYFPWSHSLLMDCVWGIVLGLIYLSRRGDRRGAIVIGLLVVSHWVLDWITHRPDMPILPNNDHRVGLGLWNNVPGTIAFEALLFAAGAWYYNRTTVARDNIGRVGLWILVAFLALTYLTNVIIPPPPTTLAVSISALALWVLVPTAAIIDRHRELRGAVSSKLSS